MVHGRFSGGIAPMLRPRASDSCCSLLPGRKKQSNLLHWLLLKAVPLGVQPICHLSGVGGDSVGLLASPLAQAPLCTPWDDGCPARIGAGRWFWSCFQVWKVFLAALPHAKHFGSETGTAIPGATSSLAHPGPVQTLCHPPALPGTAWRAHYGKKHC